MMERTILVLLHENVSRETSVKAITSYYKYNYIIPANLGV